MIAKPIPLRGEQIDIEDLIQPSYEDFLDRKTQLDDASGFDPVWMPSFLFGFQRTLDEWAIRQGRGAIFADCGLGKTPMQLVWAENVRRKTGRPVLPRHSPRRLLPDRRRGGKSSGSRRSSPATAGSPAGSRSPTTSASTFLNRADYGGVVCDESSAIKSFDGVRKAIVTDFIRKMRYRLLCSATAAPNDYIELGTSSEALGYLGYMDMLSRFFKNDNGNAIKGQRYRWAKGGTFGDPKWRFKGHAEDQFWRWVCSWARAVRRPSDLGFADEGFQLPPLEHRQTLVDAQRGTEEGDLLDLPAIGLEQERAEARRTIGARCEMVAELLQDAESAVAWCQLNPEGDLLAKLIPGAVQISGSDSPEKKEEALLGFSRGDFRVLVTKPVIGAWGLNWQHCHRMAFFPSHSYEQYYQAVRRCWRFGQKNPVLVDIVTTEGGSRALENLQRKAAQADRMFAALVSHMNDAMSVRRSSPSTKPMEAPAWL